MCTHKITIPSFLPRPDGFLPATASILPVDDRIDLVMIMLTKMMININSMSTGRMVATASILPVDDDNDHVDKDDGRRTSK